MLKYGESCAILDIAVMNGWLKSSFTKKGGDNMTTCEEIYLFLTFCLVIIALLTYLKK